MHVYNHVNAFVLFLVIVGKNPSFQGEYHIQRNILVILLRKLLLYLFIYMNKVANKCVKSY